MKTALNTNFINKHELNLGTYYFYDHYIIAEIKEGEVISLEKISDLIPIIKKYYGNGQPFTYISNRINSHSIIPTDYSDCPFLSMENFKGYAAVTYSRSCEMSTEVEKHFAKRPFYNCKNLKDAIEWTKNALN